MSQIDPDIDKRREKAADSGDLDEVIADPEFDPIALADHFMFFARNPGVWKRLTFDPQFFMGLMSARPKFLERNAHHIHSKTGKNLSQVLEETWHKKMQSKEIYGFIDVGRGLCFEISRHWKGHNTLEWDLSLHHAVDDDWTLEDTIDFWRKEWHKKDFKQISGEQKIAPKKAKVVQAVVQIRKDFKKWWIEQRRAGVTLKVDDQKKELGFDERAESLVKISEQISRYGTPERTFQIAQSGKDHIRITRQSKLLFTVWGKEETNRRMVKPRRNMVKATVKLPIGEGGEELFHRMIDWMVDNFSGEVVPTEDGLKAMETHNRKMEEQEAASK